MTTFKQEWILIRHNTTLWGVIIILALLISAAAFNGAVRSNQMAEVAATLNTGEEATKQALQKAVERWEKNPEGPAPAVTSPGSVGISILAHYTALPAKPLSPFTVGQSDVQPHYYRIDGHSPYTFMEKAEIRNPLNVLSGSFDVAFVIVFLLPVFIIAITFDLLSKEKERGVLGLILAHGVRLRDVVIGKSFSLAFIILAILFAAGVIALIITGADFMQGQTWFDFLIWFCIVAFYGFFWFALALLINSFNLASVTNGVILANLWLVFVIVVPAFVNVAATTLYPAPSRVELTTEMREASSRAQEDAAEAREAFFFDHPDMTDAGANTEDFFVQVLSTDAAVERAVKHLAEEFETQADKRQNMVKLLQYLSPAILTQEALSVVSGTNTDRFDDFAKQTLAFHDDWRSFFSRKITKGEKMSAADFDAIPAFTYRPSTNGTLLRAIAGPLFGLAVALAVILFWAIRRYRTYPAVERR